MFGIILNSNIRIKLAKKLLMIKGMNPEIGIVKLLSTPEYLLISLVQTARDSLVRGKSVREVIEHIENKTSWTTQRQSHKSYYSYLQRSLKSPEESVKALDEFLVGRFYLEYPNYGSPIKIAGEMSFIKRELMR